MKKNHSTQLRAVTAELVPEIDACPTRENGVLVLNHNFEPLNICAVRRGLVLLYLGKAEVLRFSSSTLHSASDEFLVPSVLRLHELVKRPTPQLKISRKSVLARDDYTCQYCGSRANLTIDHVFPRHRGGETTWENVVCCCLRCNNRKGNRTPQEAGMRLPHPPRQPRYVPFISFPRFISAMRHPEWREFLEGYGKGLERD
ncbi:MAG: HNH endonuclease [Armatimonadota bacterium]|nr:HNH endonuclease [Armatimonadota bacterium]